MQILVPLDLTKNEIRNALIHVLASDPSSPVEGQVYYNSVDDTVRFYTGTVWRILGRLDQISAPTASVSMNNQRITSLLEPSAAQDATTKAYVDNIATGISWKTSVRAATTANGAITTAFANGQVIDGVTLATGDRILIKDQTAPAENGIYVVAASGSPTRASDADASAELRQAAVLVESGGTNADSLWVNSTDPPITVGTTPLTFVRIGGGTSYNAGNGLQLVGNTFSVVAAPGGGLTVSGAGVGVTAPLPVGLGGTGQVTLTAKTVVVGNGTSAVTLVAGTQGEVLQINGSGDPDFAQINLASSQTVTGALPIANGGTGATTAAGARTALGTPTKYAQDVGDGAATTIVVTHNLGTRDVVVAIYRTTTPWDVIYADVEMTSTNTVTLRFAVAPTNAQYRVVITG